MAKNDWLPLFIFTVAKAPPSWYDDGGDRMDILYEDKELLVCIKPMGVLSETGGMPELLREATGHDSFFCVHRLDRAVGGLMVYAKTREAAASLSSQIAAGKLEKDYLAVVHGQPEAQGVMKDLLFHDAARNKSYVVKRMRKGVREAELSFRVLADKDGLSLVRIQLKTGRSHQIRVQFASRGMPLVGDSLYGSPCRNSRIALWSESLSFVHPKTGKKLHRAAPPPDSWPWTLFPGLTQQDP